VEARTVEVPAFGRHRCFALNAKRRRIRRPGGAYLPQWGRELAEADRSLPAAAHRAADGAEAAQHQGPRGGLGHTGLCERNRARTAAAIGRVDVETVGVAGVQAQRKGAGLSGVSAATGELEEVAIHKVTGRIVGRTILVKCLIRIIERDILRTTGNSRRCHNVAICVVVRADQHPSIWRRGRRQIAVAAIAVADGVLRLSRRDERRRGQQRRTHRYARKITSHFRYSPSPGK